MNRLRLVALFVLGACSLPDSATYSGGANDGGVRDAGPLADAAPPIDASPTDAGTGLQDAAQPSGCRAFPDAVFCADFDAVPFDKGFSRGVDQGAIATSSSSFTSGPASLVASLPSRSASRPYARLDQKLPGSLLLGSLRLSWTMRIENQGTKQDAVDLGAGLYRVGPPFCSLYLRYRSTDSDPGSLSLYEYCDATASEPLRVQFTPLTIGSIEPRFMRFELRVDVSGTGSSATLLVDDHVAVANVSLRMHEATTEQHLLVGIDSSDGAGDPITVYIDDVVIRSP